MNFIAARKEPDRFQIFDIMVNGEVVGDLILRPDIGGGYTCWDAVFNIINGRPNSLVQGFGPTQEEAIADALRAGRENALSQVMQIDRLSAEIGISQEKP